MCVCVFVCQHVCVFAFVLTHVRVLSFMYELNSFENLCSSQEPPIAHNYAVTNLWSMMIS